MARVIAVLEQRSSSPASVIDMALAMGRLSDASVEATYPAGDHGFADEIVKLCDTHNVPCTQLNEPPDASLRSEVESPDVVSSIVATRKAGQGWRLLGPISFNLLRNTDKPIVVIGPNAEIPTSIRTLFIPLEGPPAANPYLASYLNEITTHDVEIVVLHVFTEHTLPQMLDRPAMDLEVLGVEFLRRHLPHAHSIQLRHGPIVAELLATCNVQRSGLVVMPWSQDTSRGHARIIREILANSRLPVVLLPSQSGADFHFR